MSALHEGLRTIHLEPGLNTGGATEPHQIEIADGKPAHRTLIVADRHVLDIHAQLVGKELGDQTKLALQDLRVLIRDGSDPQRVPGITVVATCRETEGQGPKMRRTRPRTNQ